jgi:hypothetical protein
MADPLWDKAQLDPSYLAGHAGLRAALINAALNYGDASSIFATRPDGTSLASDYGITSNDVSGAATNPYSQLQQNKNTLAGDQQSILGGNAAHGAEFSGVEAAMQAKELAAGQARNYAAGQGLAGTLSGIQSQNTGLITGAYQNLMNQAANDPTIPAVPAVAAPAAPAAPAAAPPPLTSTTAPGDNYFNPLAPQNKQSNVALIKPPKLVMPKVGIPHQ